ncbi:hypothetical protein [Devosia salina]|uniref:Uncharacterized protein n=1 Tax=Devosia salina TaxID=2860336 RepID=A0ABX8WI61_9HYPH|nr:hypothetical protein [Devosia salina]QYO78401.1 hypothetical protein K1X15_07600 [Devosia salina]
MNSRNHIAIRRRADGSYDLGKHDERWNEIRSRLFDVNPMHRGEFCGSVMRAVWMCIFDEPHLLDQRAGIRIHDDRGYVRPLSHLILDLVRLAQQPMTPGRAYYLIREILGSDNLGDRIMSAANTRGLLFEQQFGNEEAA